jgi:uncharacterized protein (TIGR02231 family)
MKNLIVSLLCFSFFLDVQGQQNLNVVSKISKVTVFQSQAQIEASTSVTLPAGRSVIVIEDIASTTDVNSIQVRGTGDFMILGTKFQRSLISTRQTKYTEQLNTITERIEEVDMLLNVAKAETSMIEKNAEDIKSETDGLFTKDFLEMIDFTRKQLIEVGKRELTLKKEKKELTEKQKNLEREIATMGGNQQLSEILVTVDAKKPISSKINLTYLVSSAGWNPTYDIRSEGIDKNVNLNYRANVYQRTGVNWENVKLSLSTTNPRMNQTKPELYPQFLSVYTPRPIMQRNAKMANADAAFAMAPDVEMTASGLSGVVNVVESTLSVSFEIDIPYSIPSTGNPELVDIQSTNLPADYNFIAVPKFASDAFLIAKVKDWEQLNLLPGEANIYFEGAYIGKTYLNGSNTKDELKVSLGAAPKIVVERKELTNFKTKRIIGGNIKEEFVYAITIRNTSNSAVSLIVEEQIPISQDSRIEVDFDTPAGMEYERETGKLTYRVTIAPNQSVVNKINYEVKYPKELQITNL